LAYLDGVAPALQTMVAATYVRNIDKSRAFYELLGFDEHSSGRAATSAWCSLHQGTYQVLLAYTSPPLDVPALPLHLYFFYDDVDAARVATLGSASGWCQVGEPAGTPCLRKAEVKLADPSGSSAWACLDHADEILLVVRGAFTALHGEAGLAEFLAHRASEHAAH
jgi:hypothetical protein